MTHKPDPKLDALTEAYKNLASSSTGKPTEEEDKRTLRDGSSYSRLPAKTEP